MAWLTMTCRVIVGLTFFVSAVSKSRRPSAFREFQRSLPRSLPVPPEWAGRLAALVVVTEFLTALAVAVPVTTRIGFVLAAALLPALTAAIVMMIRRGSPEPCRCFGPSTRPPGRADLVRNGILFAVAVLGAAGSQGAVPLPATAVAVAAGIVLSLLLIELGEIAGLLEL